MSDSRLLDRIDSPDDLKQLSVKQLRLLASEIRELIIETVSNNGGHLAGNLGVVDLTLALHYVFDAGRDRFIFDVGHQSYTHKILTGRRKDFPTIRLAGGLSGFTRRDESPYDLTDSGHASTSISLASGFVQADKLSGRDGYTIAIIGDGSVGGGVALEGLNFAGSQDLPLLVVLNDNEMSISKNVGALSKHIAGLTTTRFYQWLTDKYCQAMSRRGGIIKGLFWLAKKFEKGLRIFGGYENVFTNLGFQYVGPIDGHDIPQLIRILRRLRQNVRRPVLLHVKTVKGKGFRPAENNPTFFHGVSPWSDKSGSSAKIIDGKIECLNEKMTFTDVFADIICRQADKDSRITAITAAMCDGTGLTNFSDKYPDRFFDVGIAEEHAVSFAAGLSFAGLRPVFAVYSTFLTRAADEIIQDVCIGRAPVVFAIDRSGLVGQDGQTHHGQFDIALLRTMPNMTLLAPSDEIEMRLAFDYAFSLDSPAAVRYPKGCCVHDSFGGAVHPPFSPENAMVQIRRGSQTAIVAVGPFADTAVAAAAQTDSSVYVLRMASPIGETVLQTLSGYVRIVTVEEGCYNGSVSEFLASRLHSCDVETVCLPDGFIGQDSRDDALCKLGFSAQHIADKIKGY